MATEKVIISVAPVAHVGTTLPDIRYWAAEMKRNSVVPELEVFTAGMLASIDLLLEEEYLSPHCGPISVSVLAGPGEVARTNVVLVQRAVQLVRLLGFEVASPEEARAMLRIPPLYQI